MPPPFLRKATSSWATQSSQFLQLPPALRAALFSTTIFLCDNEPDHYTVLNVQHDCTATDLKKQFYVLSKQTHPDVARHDPNASERFAQISHSYSILADPEKRRRYDRDHLHRNRQISTGGPAPGHKGSYAGSRPASGLSKRPGAFRGPPPSFYAHGKTKTHSDASTTNATRAGADGGEPTMGSAYPGINIDESFDPTSTFRTQTQEDTRRTHRRSAAMERAQAEMEDDAGFWVRFMIVAGIIVGAVSVGTIFASQGIRKGGLTRGDGSRRDGPSHAWAKG